MVYLPLFLKKWPEIGSFTINPNSIVSGYRATGLYPFNPKAIHYERLTATNSAKFDKIAFRTVEAADFKIAVRCMEVILGKETTDRLNHAIQTSTADVPQVSLLDVWKRLTELASSEGAAGNADTGLISTQCCSSSAGQKVSQWLPHYRRVPCSYLL